MTQITSKKGLISIGLVMGPLLLLIWQQLTGIIPLRDGTADRAIFSVLMGICICAGFAIQGSNGKDIFNKFLLSAAIIIGVPMIISGILVINDAAQGTELTETKGIWFVMDAMSSQVTEWTALLQTIVGLVPVAVVVVGVVFIYIGDGPDEYATAALETAFAIGVCVLAALLFGWLGIDIF